MKLSKAQLIHIQERRKWINQRQKDILSIGDARFKSTDLTREMVKMYQEEDFYNLLIQLHNVEVQAEKALEGSMSKEDYEAIYGWGGQG